MLLTRELGLIKATAQSVSVPHSKLRPGLLEFNHSLVSLVRGRSSWKITGAVPIENVFTGLRSEKELCQIFARSFSLLRRLVQGEERNEELFDHIAGAYSFARSKGCNSSLVANFEYVLLLRILHSLGYVGSAPGIAHFINSPYWNDDVLRTMDSVQALALSEINKSLRASHL